MSGKCSSSVTLVWFTLVVALLPGAALAQTSIAGLVADETGGVLPGVTVEAASPALIGGVRTAVTDGQGRYAIVELQPGIYSVTFTLPGFSTFVRDEIQVTSGAVVPINAELSVGTLEETITVSGASPVVDIQQASQRQVLSKEMLELLPTNRTVHSAAVLIPGMRMNGVMMGGQGSTIVQRYVVARGKGKGQNSSLVEGIDTRMVREGGDLSYNNFAMADEVSVQINPATAEISGGGVSINMIPREGGNTWGGDIYFSAMDSSFQANNITDELREAGLRTPDGTDNMFDLNPAYGGPIVRDKLWVFMSGRVNHAKLTPAGGTFFEPNPVTGVLEPGTEQGFNDTQTDNISFRLTWQAARNHKISTYRDQWWRGQTHFRGTSVQDWATVPKDYNPGWQFIWPTKWTYTATNRVLIEAGVSRYHHNATLFFPQPGVLREAFTPEWFANAAQRDLATGLQTVSGGNNCCWHSVQPSNVYMGSISYVTGSHTFKTGLQGRWGYRENFTDMNNGALEQRYRNGVPQSVSVAGRPSFTRDNMNRDIGFYAQDRWTIDRLTVNAGLRVEIFKGEVGASTAPAGRFVPERTIVPFDVFDFTDVLPRFSVVYDLFGNARTAVKFSAGRYVETRGVVEISSRYNPISSASETRNWFDCDLVPGSTTTCSGLNLPTNGDNIAQDNEIPASTNPLFGLRGAFVPNPDLERPSSWDYSLSVQQEITEGVSVTAAWYHTRETNLWGSRDRGITIDDYTPFLLANPSNPSEMITVYNLYPGTATGDIQDVASGINERIYNGYELSIQARLPTGGQILAGFYTDRKVSVLCDTNNPNLLRFCDHSGGLFQELGAVPTLPFLHEWKFAFTHPLPWDFLGSLAFISLPGNGAGATGGGNTSVTWENVTYAVPSSQFPGGRTVPVTVQLAPPGTVHLDRWNQLDLSLKRTFRMGGVEVLPSIDLYNVTNGVPVLRALQGYPSNGRPTLTLPGRLLRLGFLMRF